MNVSFPDPFTQMQRPGILSKRSAPESSGEIPKDTKIPRYTYQKIEVVRPKVLPLSIETPLARQVKSESFLTLNKS